MNISVDKQSLLGFLSATGLPAIFYAIIGFLHPSLYTLTCGVPYVDGAASCYADARTEAILWLLLSIAAVAYGGITFWSRLSKNPTPPVGANAAIIPAGQVPVTVDKDGTVGLATAKATPASVEAITPIAGPAGGS